MLRATESQLADRLDEACSHGVEGETTAELVRLEETLSEAARVAKQAVSLRRRLRTGHGPAAAEEADGGSRPHADAPAAAEGASPSQVERRAGPPADRPQDPGESDSAAVREFLDRKGVGWRVWAVSQEQLHPERLVAMRMDAYREGWLTFESTDGRERRRLPQFPPHWRKLTNLDLEGLLERAEPVRSRRSAADDSETSIS